ncbi:MAG: hypothetical protein Q9202_003932 [Teloschistes flavicans]
MSGRQHEQGEHELSVESEDEEISGHEEIGSKTPAELRAEKRKMKRFRLTHNQTRFLMSEFARQAHPDASQRQRLSQEIPGLSPRQVQVWFQNRRAKLKRLTVDDQASMLKSRALPAGFNTTQTLHYPYDRPSYGDPADFPMHYPSSDFGPDIRRPLTTGGLTSLPGDTETTSPTSGTSSFGEGYQTPRSLSMSANLSPTSPSSDSPQGLTTSTSQHTRSPAVTSSIRSRSYPTLYPTPFESLEFAAQGDLLRSRAASSAHPRPNPYLQGYAENDSDLQHRQESLRSHMQHNSYTRTDILHYPPAGTPQDPSAITMNTDPTTNYRPWPQALIELGNTSSIDLSCGINANCQPHYRSVKEVGGGRDCATASIHSAPLAMPPEFHNPQWTQPYQSSEFQLPIRHAYNAHVQASPSWLSDQSIDPYQPARPHRPSFSANAASSLVANHDQEGIAFESKSIERWPE